MSTFIEEDPQLKQQQEKVPKLETNPPDNDNPIQTYFNTLGKEHIELARKKVLGHTSFMINLREQDPA
jgi:hypothetical protein